jgi:hypothetical protein
MSLNDLLNSHPIRRVSLCEITKDTLLVRVPPLLRNAILGNSDVSNREEKSKAHFWDLRGGMSWLPVEDGVLPEFKQSMEIMKNFPGNIISEDCLDEHEKLKRLRPLGLHSDDTSKL